MPTASPTVRYPTVFSGLRDAREGKPTEEQAARSAALYSTGWVAMGAILAGTQLVGPADSFGRLVLVCASVAVVAVAVGFAAVMLAYRLAGFGLIRWLANSMIGALIGLQISGLLFTLLIVADFLDIAHLIDGDSIVLFLLCPIMALVWPLWVRRPAQRTHEAQVG